MAASDQEHSKNPQQPLNKSSLIFSILFSNDKFIFSTDMTKSVISFHSSYNFGIEEECEIRAQPYLNHKTGISFLPF